jgi:methylphosphotriester-DNA--protein-cysteine methyltransferase
MQNSAIEQGTSADHLSEEDKWHIVLNRDQAYNVSFVYAVRSTGIYCKPSCPAKRLRSKHVMFLSSAQDAERRQVRLLSGRYSEKTSSIGT